MIELKIGDLVGPCKACGGSGALNTEQSHGSRVGITRTTNGGPSSCPECFGRKQRLTEAGKVLKEFMDKVKEYDL